MKTLVVMMMFILLSLGRSAAQACTIKMPDSSTSQFGYCDPIPKFPRIPKIDFPKLPSWPVPKDVPEFKHVPVETVYSVTFTSLNPHPPSCRVIAGRIKNHTARIFEMNGWSQKLEKNEKLSFDQIRSFLELSRRYLPEVLDEIDQTVELNLTWKFLNVPKEKNWIFNFFLDDPSDFTNFRVEGPGLKWTQNGEGPAPYFSMRIDENVSMTYEMQMMDFCFGENSITLRGKTRAEFGPQDPVLKASWERNIQKVNQMGAWQILTAAEFENYGK